jgi:divalent metal cation (Fe/Co/Zn/Cd) transporter
MIVTKKDKFLAVIIVVAIFITFLGWAWFSKIGGFGILADVIQNPKVLQK